AGVKTREIHALVAHDSFPNHVELVAKYCDRRAGARAYSRDELLLLPSHAVRMRLPAVPDPLVAVGALPDHQRPKVVGERGCGAGAAITQAVLIGITSPPEVNALIVS